MAVSVTASDVQKNFGSYHDLALAQPVRVTKYGRETVFIVSARDYHALKQGQREAVSADELSDAEMDLIDQAEVPSGERYSLNGVD